MTRSSHLAHLACGVAMACAAFAAEAQSKTTPPENIQLQKQEIAKGDPARWYQEDASSTAQMRTLRKEIGAALAEANIACKKGPASERDACLKEARATYQQDMANAPQILAQSQK
jgi:hypothetical protein